MVKCRPFYLPREFSAVIVTVVYITPQARKYKKLNLNERYEAINKQENLDPKAAFIVASDFNTSSLTHDAKSLSPLALIKS